MVSLKGKEKADDDGKGNGKRKLKSSYEDKTGRKRNPGVLQFVEDAGYEVVEDKDDSSSDESMFDYDEFPDEVHEELNADNNPAMAHTVPLAVKEEYIEIAFEQVFEERYKPGSNLVRYAEDGYYSKKSSMPLQPDSVEEIWKVKCVVGRERHSAFCLMQKYVDLEHMGTKLPLISASALDHVKGYIFIEAQKHDIYEACKGICSIYSTRCVPVSYSEFYSLAYARSEFGGISRGKWARVKNGKYKSDLAQVADVDHSRGKATIKLVPRIDLKEIAEKIGGGVATKRGVIPPQRLISRRELEEFRQLIQSRRDRDTNEMFEILDGMMLADGYLYKKIAIESLIFWGVTPTEDELIKFEHLAKNEEADVQWLSQLYGEKKEKLPEPVNRDKGGEKSVGSSSASVTDSDEEHNLVGFGRNDFGVVVGPEKDSVKVLKEGSEGPLVINVKQSALNDKGGSILSNSSHPGALYHSGFSSTCAPFSPGVMSLLWADALRAGLKGVEKEVSGSGGDESQVSRPEEVISLSTYIPKPAPSDNQAEQELVTSAAPIVPEIIETPPNPKSQQLALVEQQRPVPVPTMVLRAEVAAGKRKAGPSAAGMKKQRCITSTISADTDLQPMVYYNEAAGWGSRLKKDRGLELDLPLSLDDLTPEEKVKYLNMVAPPQDRFLAYQESLDSIKESLAHHWGKMTTQLAALTTGVPSNDVATWSLEREKKSLTERVGNYARRVDELKDELKVARKELKEARAELKVEQQARQAKVAEADQYLAQKKKALEESFALRAEEVKASGRAEGHLEGVQLCHKELLSTAAGQKFLSDLVTGWREAYLKDTLSLHDFVPYMQHYFLEGFKAGGKGLTLDEATKALPFPSAFSGDPKAPADPNYWVPTARRCVEDLVQANLGDMQDVLPLGTKPPSSSGITPP